MGTTPLLPGPAERPVLPQPSAAPPLAPAPTPSSSTEQATSDEGDVAPAGGPRQVRTTPLLPITSPFAPGPTTPPQPLPGSTSPATLQPTAGAAPDGSTGERGEGGAGARLSAATNSTDPTRALQSVGGQTSLIDKPTARAFTPAEQRKVVVAAAKSQLGVPYSWGAGDEYGATLGQPTGEYPYQATHTVGFDCSGLVLYALAQVGINLPHYSGAGGQWSAGKPISTSALRPGDLVFFEGRTNPQHVGIYIGSGEYIEAPYTGSEVKISKLAGDPSYVGARRVIP